MARQAITADCHDVEATEHFGRCRANMAPAAAKLDELLGWSPGVIRSTMPV